jgi:hypothetical protein
MSKLIIKSRDVNTLRSERLSDLANGNAISALMTPANYASSHNAARIEAVGVSDYGFDKGVNDGVVLAGAKAISAIGKQWLRGGVDVTQMTSGMDFQMPCLGKKTLRETILAGGVKMEGESLLPNWSALWDAMRIDLTIRKVANPTVREFIYNVQDTPDADATMNVTELYPDFIEFKAHNGTGESVEMGELLGGNTDTMEQLIYAAGLTWDLKKELFDRTLDMSRINDGVAVGESAIRDDNAIAPILNYSYSGANQTAADATSGATREELYYNTIQNAIDGMTARRDPITLHRLNTTGAVILCDPIEAKRVAQSINGFPGSGTASGTMKNKPALSDISRVIGYEGERMVGRTGTKTYTDVASKKAYMIIPNRYMMIAVKRGLQLDVDRTPDVLKLSRQQMAWWFCEALYTKGIQYFVQEITLPAW